MTKAFENKVIREGCVDTHKYRYIYRVFANRAELRRIPIEYLNTTAAIAHRDIIKVYRQKEALANIGIAE